eukprot:CAMPEP_0172790396 /NCGR_PEP_ID=MMETSP1074-20121228/207944_1 /TAXON_ID=2916 /ORGANISM="Ceratium fusus, Strain PA161109" /LENGTH=260 /DNA_ID=CAMNT_0013627445 /DNA_START=221 /DNA_END=1003 /DNA_ORIENTATION=+
MSKATVQPDTLHAFEILSKRLVKKVRIFLRGLAILDVALFVEHPCRNLELKWIADHCHNLVDLVCCEFASALVKVNVAFLANNVGDAATNAANCRECVHHLLAAVHIRVAHSQNVLEVLGLELDRHVAGFRSKIWVGKLNLAGAKNTILDVTLFVEHPCRNLELKWIADHCHDLVDLICCEFTSTLVEVNVALLTNNVRDASTNAADGRERVHHLLATIHVCIAHSQNVLEVLGLKLDRHDAGCGPRLLGEELKEPEPEC